MSTDPRSIGEMFADLARETRTLVQQEIRLAKTELAQDASRMTGSVTMILAGGLIAYGGLLAIVAAVVLGLMAVGLAAWAAALVGGVVIAGIGYGLVRAGLASFRPQDLTPRQTIETLKEDARWLRLIDSFRGTLSCKHRGMLLMWTVRCAGFRRFRPAN